MYFIEKREVCCHCITLFSCKSVSKAGMFILINERKEEGGES